MLRLYRSQKIENECDHLIFFGGVMKFQRIIIAAIIALGFFSFSAVAAENIEQKIIKIKTITPLEVKKTADIESKITGLTEEAIKAGLPEVVLQGTIKYEKISDKVTRSKIEWNGIAIREGTSDKTRSLSSPLFSQFTTQDKRVEPNTELSAKGNFEKLLQDILELKKQQERPKKTVEEVSRNKKDSFSPSGYEGSSVGSSSVGGDTASDSAFSEFQVNKISTVWEPCAPRVSKADGLVYRQARKVSKGESGDIISSGECQDYGGTVAIIKDYNNNCSKTKDFDNGKVYYQYIEYAEIDGETLSISGCTNDFLDYATIQAIKSDCGIRHDFLNHISILQEKLYYKDKTDNTVYITECQDSDTRYQHYQTSAGCIPVINTAQGIVIPQSRVAYKIGSVEFYASECRADETDQYEIREAFCDPKFEHDFVNNVSYYRTYDYYVNELGETNAINECSRSASASFPHIFETSDCSIINDDELMQTRFRSKRQIETPDGIIEISGCQDKSYPVAYVPIDTTEKTKNYNEPGEYNFKVPAGITKLTVTVKAGDGGGVADQEICRGIPGTGGDQGDPERECYTIWGKAGKAGEQKTETLTVVTGEEIISLKVAAKGDSGKSGGDSQFGNLIAKGGGVGGSGLNGSGLNGLISIKWYETKYKRGDGTIYDPQGE
jgi:hypothetical protein